MPTSDPGSAPGAATDFSQRVRRCFAGGATGYGQRALLQRAVAWRLAHHCRPLPLPEGPWADLGAGSGLLSEALALALGSARCSGNLLRVDNCPQLLRQGGPGASRDWDLNQGLPQQLQGAALLASNFALQWLSEPQQQLRHWCQALAPGGWLALAVPTAGSFQLWHRAAAAARVPFTGLRLPEATALEALVGRELVLHHSRRLRFSRPQAGALAVLGQFKALGAQASRARRLEVGELRRLQAHWPTGPHHRLEWEVLLLVAQRAP